MNKALNVARKLLDEARQHLADFPRSNIAVVALVDAEDAWVAAVRLARLAG